MQLNEDVMFDIAEISLAFRLLNEVRDAEGALPPEEFDRRHDECERWIERAVGQLIDHAAKPA